MTVSIKHKFVNLHTDGADATVVRPSNWNDDHDLTGLGTAAELDVGTGVQAYSANLDSWSLVAPGSYLTVADAGTTYQPLSTNLTSWAAVAPSSYLTTSAAAAAYQPIDSDLTTWAGLTPSANFQTMVPHTFAQMRTDLGLVIGTNVQAFDADLTTWAGITPATGIGTFLATPSSANLKAAITDETGSGALVFGTSPAITTPTGIVKGDVGLGNVDNTSDATKNSATATLINKTLTSPTMTDPVLGTPASGTLTNCTGTASGLTAGAATNGITSDAVITDGEVVIGDGGARKVKGSGSAPVGYDTGNATPTFTFATVGNLSISYTRQHLRYTRIGNRVFFDLDILATPTFTTASGALTISGLPFTCIDYSLADGSVTSGAFLFVTFSGDHGVTQRSGSFGCTARVISSDTKIDIRWISSASNYSALTAADCFSGGIHRFMISGSYECVP